VLFRSGLNGFVGEFLVLLGAATSGATYDGFAPGPLGYGYVIPAALGIILGAVYMLWMCQRVLFGPLKEPAGTPDTSAGLTHDLTRREIGILVPIALACILLGVYPKPMLNSFDNAVAQNILREPAAAVQAMVDPANDDVVEDADRPKVEDTTKVPVIHDEDYAQIGDNRWRANP